MPRFLVTCDCGALLPVEPGQAGGQITCKCGKSVEVPTLRHLRHLPVEKESSSTKGKAWNARIGAVSALVICAGLLCLAVLGVRLSEPRAAPFDKALASKNTRERIDKLTPAEAWLWGQHYRAQAEHGFVVYESNLTAAEKEQVEQKRFLGKVLLLLAGGLLAVAAVVALWPRGPIQKPSAAQPAKHS